MKRIGIISDSHSDPGHVQLALIKLEAEGRIDALIHCGDGAHDPDMYTGNIMQVVAVRGNNDGWLDQHKDEMFVTIAGVPIFVTHGHRYNVKRGLDVLAEAAAAKGARICCFGHTHKPFCDYMNGVLLINPGACLFTGRCALLTISDHGEPAVQML